MVPRAIAEVRARDFDGANGRATLLNWGRALRRVLFVHPGVAGVLVQRPVIGTGIFRGLEALLGPLQREAFGPEDGARAIYAVLFYTLSFVLWEPPRVRDQPKGAYAARWREGFARQPVGKFPRVAAALSCLGTLASAAQWEFGLQALVTGLVDAE